MKKIIPILGLSLLLTACGHKHDFASWNSDLESHWQVCQCGEKTEAEAHTPDEFGYCGICGLSVATYEDGTYSVFTYDEQGAVKSQIDYDEDGTVLSEMVCDMEYDEHGNATHKKLYYNGVLDYECFYEPVVEGDMDAVYVSREILYAGDCQYISQYDASLNLLSSTTCDAEGNVLATERYEYEFDHLGNIIKTTCYVDEALSTVSEAMVGPDGGMYNVSTVYYEQDQVLYTMTNQYEFDEDGHMTVKREYTDDILFHEIHFAMDPQQGQYLAYEASYDETGALLHAYTYDTKGNIIP